MNRPAVAFVVALLAVSLYVANFSLWLRSEVIDSEAFVATTVEVLNEPEAREATATLMVVRLVERVPILLVVQAGLVEIFTELLATDELQELLAVLGQELHTRMVAGDPGALVLDLDPFREPLLAPFAELAPELVDEVPDTWFDAVAVLDDGVIPNVEPFISLTGLVAFVAGVSSLSLIVVTAVLSNRWWKAAALVGGAAIVAGAATALLVPVAGSFVSGRFSDVSLDVLATSLYEGLTDSLTARSLLLVLFGLVLGGVALIAVANQPRNGD